MKDFRSNTAGVFNNNAVMKIFLLLHPATLSDHGFIILFLQIYDLQFMPYMSVLTLVRRCTGRLFGGKQSNRSVDSTRLP